MRAIIIGFCVALALSGMAFAQAPAAPTPSDSSADRAAIAASVHRQLARCWNMPPGYAGQRVSVTLAFLGDGSLSADPVVEATASKSSSKLAPLLESALLAVRRCAPFTGLEALGARAQERFSIVVDFAS